MLLTYKQKSPQYNLLCGQLVQWQMLCNSKSDFWSQLTSWMEKSPFIHNLWITPQSPGAVLRDLSSHLQKNHPLSSHPSSRSPSSRLRSTCRSCAQQSKAMFTLFKVHFPHEPASTPAHLHPYNIKHHYWDGRMQHILKGDVRPLNSKSNNFVHLKSTNHLSLPAAVYKISGMWNKAQYN